MPHALCRPSGAQEQRRGKSEEKEETEGVGADITIVAAPAARPQEQAVDMVRRRGDSVPVRLPAQGEQYAIPQWPDHSLQ